MKTYSGKDAEQVRERPSRRYFGRYDFLGGYRSAIFVFGRKDGQTNNGNAEKRIPTGQEPRTRGTRAK